MVSLKPPVRIDQSFDTHVWHFLLTDCPMTGIDDDTTRRDSMHAIINSLPDPNYATLRALTLVSMLTVIAARRQ